LNALVAPGWEKTEAFFQVPLALAISICSTVFDRQRRKNDLVQADADSNPIV
jgi:hypothetical protein